MALMVSVSGIRGIFGEDLTPQNLVNYAAAYGTWQKGGTIVVGRDSRVTGQICEDLVCSTLQSTGCDVVKVGIVPTPTVAMEVLRHDANGAIIITASHNPAQWNALKMLNSKGEFLDAEEGAEVLAIAERGHFAWQPYDRIGMMREVDDAVEDHIEKILALPYIDAEAIAARGFNISVDAVNGAGSIALPQLLERLGANVHRIHCKPNGKFPHNPEPLPEHLGDIIKAMEICGCDLGFVTDPDADRLAIVDEYRNVFGEEYTQVAAFDFMMRHKPGDTATNLSSSRAADVITKRAGYICHRSAVGEINVVKKMESMGAVIGGEGNGGVINPDLHAGRDALVGAAMFLQLLTELDMTVSEYRATLPHFEMSKQKVELREMTVNADELLEQVTVRFKDEKITTIDGVKIDFEEGWVHLRKSNTEPIVRVYSEAATKAEAEALAKRVVEL